MKVSILIVDDNETDRYLLKRYIKKTGLDVVFSEVVDGQYATEFFDNYEAKRKADPDGFPPLLIFLDINMPRMNGFEFLERYDAIRHAHAPPSTVVIMFSSSPRQDDRDRAFKWNFVRDFIVKGETSPAHLKGLIEEHVMA